MIQKTVDQTQTSPRPAPCFTAGTMVHTSEGLVPIEKIGVGDWVLSKPDQGGEQAYKRVVKTIRHEDEPVMLLRYEAAHDENIVQSLFVTANHPFWVPGMGWKSANYLEGDVDVELTDGTAAPVLCSVQLYRSTEKMSAGCNAHGEVIQTLMDAVNGSTSVMGRSP
jgi:hypothetical protein